MKFSPGDVVPWFIAPTHTTAQFHFSAAAGRYVVLSFLGTASQPATLEYVAALQTQAARFDDENCCFFGVTVDMADINTGRLSETLPGMRFFQDPSGTVSRAFAALPAQPTAEPAVYRPFTLILDPRLRVLDCLPLESSGNEHAARVFQVLDKLPALGFAEVAASQAPVLLVPRIFEPELCQRLIALFNEHGGEESGFMRDMDGKTVGVYDFATKRRQDCTIEDEQLRQLCAARINGRLVPQIRRAFQFNATRMERYIVARYEGGQGGHFRAHRDNTTKATAHRRFAVTLNLNDGYAGGYLWFPEYGRRQFRPGIGEACVFSCSVLHEATPVTAGVRYVFLPFLYDDAAADIRQKSEQFLGGDLNERPT